MLERLKHAGPVATGYVMLALLLVVGLRSFTIVWVAGRSMEPALVPGDVAVVARRLTPGVGDIALLRSGESLVLHRVTRVQRNGTIQTRGDANPVGDFRPTQRADVAGRVVAVMPLGALVHRWRLRSACDTLPAQLHTAWR